MNQYINRQLVLQVIEDRISLRKRWTDFVSKEIAKELHGLNNDIMRSFVILEPSVAISAVLTERTRQDAKWGEQNHEPMYWAGILGEEYGELCQAINETVFNNGPEEQKKGGYANMRAEAVQVAAVAVAFVEMLDRNYGRGISRES